MLDGKYYVNIFSIENGLQLREDLFHRFKKSFKSHFKSDLEFLHMEIDHSKKHQKELPVESGLYVATWNKKNNPYGSNRPYNVVICVKNSGKQPIYANTEFGEFEKFYKKKAFLKLTHKHPDKFEPIVIPNDIKIFTEMVFLITI